RDVDGHGEQEALRDVDPRDLARDDVLDLPGFEEPEDVAVGVQEQQHDPQCGDLEPDTDLGVLDERRPGPRHASLPQSWGWYGKRNEESPPTPSTRGASSSCSSCGS